MILVHIDHDRGEIDPLSLQALTLARSLGESIDDADVHAVVTGAGGVVCADQLALFGAIVVHLAENPSLNDYAPQANASGRSLQKIAAEMAHLRSSTIDLFESFTPEMLIRKGMANNNELSVIVLGFIIAGHETHHCNVLSERYLSGK